MIIYVGIGNSDDKLPQEKWANLQSDLAHTARMRSTTIHGIWYSHPSDRYQNMCVCAELPEGAVGRLKQELGEIKELYAQDAIAFAVAETEFI